MNDDTDECEDDVFFLTQAGEDALELRDLLEVVEQKLGITEESSE